MTLNDLVLLPPLGYFQIASHGDKGVVGVRVWQGERWRHGAWLSAAPPNKTADATNEGHFVGLGGAGLPSVSPCLMRNEGPGQTSH